MEILIADDEREIVEILSLYFEKEGFIITTALTGDEALNILKARNFNIVLLDIMMPGATGYNVLKEVNKDTPVIFISAKTRVSDKILGLDLGAYDYITKPFDPLEVVARVKAILRRQTKSSITTAGDIKIDENAHRVFISNNEIILTAKEFQLLSLLLNNIDIVLSKDRICSILWPDDQFLDDNTVRVHIGNLRNKINESNSVKIKTLRNLGYRLEVTSV